MNKNESFYLPPEWSPQDGILLTWPHENTDWGPNLNDVEPVYVEIVRNILRFESVVLVVNDSKEKQRVEALLLQTPLLQTQFSTTQIYWVIAPTDDTWARDHGPITVINDRSNEVKPINYQFNGWGQKYLHAKDNAINEVLFSQSYFNNQLAQNSSLILEGGGIELNEHQTLLTTKACLLNSNRNPEFDLPALEQIFRAELGIKHFHWLDNGYLAGDDTDSHIDTLARFAPNNTIVYVACDDENDEHYMSLKSMESELNSFKTKSEQSYRLLALPWPKAKFNTDGERLPATYANYLIINGAVLVPTYNDNADQKALDIIATAYPDREIIGINCVPIINQFGSLHCLTMQLPYGLLKSARSS